MEYNPHTAPKGKPFLTKSFLLWLQAAVLPILQMEHHATQQIPHTIDTDFFQSQDVAYAVQMHKHLTVVVTFP